MSRLRELVQSYLKGSDSDVLVTDQWATFTRAEFYKKVFQYVDLFNQSWASVPSSSKSVAILLERNADYLAAIFATWISGGFYLPLHTNTPVSLNQKYIDLSGVSFLLTNESFKNVSGKKNEVPCFKSEQNNLAYIIFTSGSTGEKKGVAISKSSLVAYADAIKAQFSRKFTARSLIINGELTFDISIADLIFALLFRAEICITEESKNLLSLCALVQQRNVEAIYAVPSTWEKIIELEKKLEDFSFSCVRNIFSGGEALSISLVRQLKELCPFATIFNMYGPTEFTVNATYFEVTDELFSDTGLASIPLGYPLPSVKVNIVANPPDNTGELYLSGPQMMIGYVNAKTPFVVKDGVSYYPTGDLCYKDKTGLIHYIGRIRDYDKVSGYRINLLSIERQFEGVIDGTIKLRISDGKIICLVRQNDNEAEHKICEKINQFAVSFLEPYERPSKIYCVKEFPLNSSGKLDWRE